MTADLERRQVARPVSFRASDSGVGTLYGYASVFNQFSQNLGGFVEQVDPGAFNKSIGDGVPVLCRYNHDDNQLLGTTEAQTLRLEIDATGLAYEDDLPDTTSGRDVSVLGKRGDLKYSSFAFRTIEDDWGITPQGFPLRTLLAVQLVDVAPVNSPAYLDSSSGIRSLAHKLDVEVDVVSHATTDELRSLILGEPIDIPAVEARGEDETQPEGRETPTPLLDLARRRLDLEHLR
jgi:HK97 family phage prohead protease